MQNYKLGKHPARRDTRTLRLATYISKLAPAPAAFDLTKKMTDIGMMLNDNLGDCTCAAVGHIIQQWTAENEDQVILQDSVIEKLYEAVGGYVPGEPNTDNGAVLLDVLNYWTKNTVATHKLGAYVAVDPKIAEEVKNSVFYFGNVYVGVELPLSAQDQDVWSVPFTRTLGKGKPNSWGGHAIPIVAYDEDTLTCITWGAFKKMTWDFFHTYCDEAFALLSPDWLAKDGRSPVGFNIDQLQADILLINS